MSSHPSVTLTSSYGILKCKVLANYIFTIPFGNICGIIERPRRKSSVFFRVCFLVSLVESGVKRSGLCVCERFDGIVQLANSSVASIKRQKSVIGV